MNFTIGADGSAFAGDFVDDNTIIKIVIIINSETDSGHVVKAVSHVPPVLAQVQQLKKRHGTE